MALKGGSKKGVAKTCCNTRLHVYIGVYQAMEHQARGDQPCTHNVRVMTCH